MEALFNPGYKARLPLANDRDEYYDDGDDTEEEDLTVSMAGQRRHELMPLYADRGEPHEPVTQGP